MNVSTTGIDFIDDAEGRAAFEYPDVEGNPTIGIGHLLTRSELTSGKICLDEQYIKYRNGLTDEQMDNLLLQDLDSVEAVINRLVKVPLAQYQFDALASFTFNVGNGAFAGSTLLRKLRMGLYQEVPTQLRRWNKAREKGKLVVNRGLVNRREADIKLWNNQWRVKYV